MKHLLVSLCISLFSISALYSDVYAEPLDFSIYPPITEIITTPQTTLKAPITITNHTNEIQNLQLSIKPFEAASEDGTVTFTDEKEIEAINSMIRLEKNGQLVTDEITLRPIETAHLELTVSIPEEYVLSEKIGDYYFVVLFETKHEREIEQSASRIQARMGSIVLLSIRHPARLDEPIVRLKDFSTQAIFTGEPIVFSLRIENRSSHFINAKGEIIVSDFSGNEIKKILLPSQNLLVGSTRNLTFETPPIESQKLFGKYVADAFITVGKDNLLYKRLTFFVIPKKIGIISLIILLGSVALVMRFHSYSRSLFSSKHKSSLSLPRTKSKKKIKLSP